jgi:uncharacterized hydrophobic protein (TIGR00271 family)
MLHLRVVAPEDRAERVLELLTASPAVCNVVHLRGAATKPDGDLLLADVAREDASVLLDDLRGLEIPEYGSIALEQIDTAISEQAKRAERAADGQPSDAVVWEEVEERTSENAEVSWNFLAFMAIAMLLAAIGIVTDQPILIVGSMVVGPEFGPIAGVCVALVQRRGALARRSLVALAVGFPFGIAVACAGSLALHAAGLVPPDFASQAHPLTDFISQPDAFSIIVAFLAGAAGVLSLTSAKSGALIGVLISVTTIPAAGNVGLAAGIGDWGEAFGAAAQLGVNLAAILLAGVLILSAQRLLFVRRQRQHQSEQGRRETGLPARSSKDSRPAVPTAADPTQG